MDNNGYWGPAVDASLALMWLRLCEMIAGERSERLAKELRGEVFENEAECAAGDNEDGDAGGPCEGGRGEVCTGLGEARELFALGCVEVIVVGSKEAGIGGGGISSSSSGRMSTQQTR